MKRKQRGSSDLFGIVFPIILLVIVWGVCCMFDSYGCHSRWRGHVVSYGPVQGCLVKTEQGFVSEDNIRMVIDNAKQ